MVTAPFSLFRLRRLRTDNDDVLLNADRSVRTLAYIFRERRDVSLQSSRDVTICR